MKKTDKCTTILYYHKEALNKVLYNKYNLEFLKEIGYRDFSNEESFLFKLKSRFKDTCPHEIGIFRYTYRGSKIFYRRSQKRMYILWLLESL